MKIIYHKDDLDGKCSAAIIYDKYPKSVLVPWNYTMPLPECEPGETVFMVDCCPNDLNDLIEYDKKCCLIWIDHHGSKIEESFDAGFNPAGIRREGIGACFLVWEYINKFDRVPYSVKLLAQYDVWDHSNPDCLPFQYGMRCIDNNPSSNIWEKVFWTGAALVINAVINNGKVVIEYQKEQWGTYIKECGFETEFEGLKVIACNLMLANSQLFDSVWDENKWDAMITFGWRDSQWIVSIYSTKDLNLSKNYASLYGGGGHAKAAGFNCKNLPFELK